MQTHKHGHGRGRTVAPRRRRNDPLPRASVIDVDPEDPNQVLEAGGLEDEIVEARPASPIDEHDDDREVSDRRRDTGELYGLHVQPASDTALAAAEDRDAFRGSERGEHWFEALEERAIEGGLLAERELVIIDDGDHHAPPPATDRRDRPKADRGSGGRGGL